MNRRPALLVVGMLFMLAFFATPTALAQNTTTSSSSSSSSSSSVVALTIYPNGSIGIAADVKETSSAPPGTVPNSTVGFRVSTSDRETTVVGNGTVAVPSSELSQAPFNYSESLSGSGNYTKGVSEGSIIVHALSGVETPLTSMVLNYRGNSTMIVATGSDNLTYGNYGNGLVLDYSTISGNLSQIQSEEFNQSYINEEFSLFPYNNLTDLNAKTLSLTATYGSSSAAVNEDIVITGNMTALPAALEEYYACDVVQASHQQCTLFSSSPSAVQSYSYNFAYSGGLLSFSYTMTTTQNIDSLLQAEAGVGSSSGLTPAQDAYLNSTKVDISGLSGTISLSQSSSGEEVYQIIEKGATISPEVTIQANEFNESAFFSLQTSTGIGNFTVIGGSGPTGSVSIQVPPSVTGPTSSTADSDTWNNVNATSLADLQFAIVSQSSTSSTSTSSSSTSTSSTSTSSSSSIPEFPAQLGLAAVVTVVIVMAYGLTRRSLRTGKQALPSTQFFGISLGVPSANLRFHL